MIGVVIVAHGGLAQEYLAAVEHVLGPQQGMRAVAIAAQEDRDAKRAEIAAAADAVDSGGGVVLVADIFGGSPCNLALASASHSDRCILYGVSLPTLIKLTKSRHLPVGEAVRKALAAGRKYLDCVGGFGE